RQGAGGEIPDGDGLIAAAANERFSVGREAQSRDAPTMPGEPTHLLAVAIPDANDAVLAAADDLGAVRCEDDSADGERMLERWTIGAEERKGAQGEGNASVRHGRLSATGFGMDVED